MAPESTALGLGLLTVVLVGPGPIWVHHWRFLHRVPRAAVTLWQAGTVASLVAVVLAGVVAGRAVALGGPAPRPHFLAAHPVLLLDLLVALFAALVLLRLGWSLVSVARHTRARRSRHRAAVDLLGRVDDTLTLPGLRVVAGTLPLAYCLPSLRDARVVLSSGALAALSETEVRAVLAHEEAHIRARHDLVLDTFTALHRAFPHLVRSEIPVLQCRLLVEMLADDAAARRTGPLPLARALVALAGAPVPDAALGAAGTGVAERVERLGRRTGSEDRLLSTAVYLLAVALVLSAPAFLAASAFVIT